MANSKNGYQKKMWIYKNRLDEYKRKYNGSGFISKTKRYTDLQNKLSYWRYRVRKIDKKNKEVDDLIYSINAYFNVDIRQKRKRGSVSLALMVYFKFGLEKGISGTYLSGRVKRRRQAASEQRKKLNKSISGNVENRNAFYGFKNYHNSIGLIAGKK